MNEDIEEPVWLRAIPDEGDQEAVRAVLARKRWRDEHEPPHPAWDVP